MADDDKQEVSGQEKTPDPVVDGSLSGQIVVFSVLLFLSLVWALFDEIGFERPWKRYQQQFTKLYAAHLQKLRPRHAPGRHRQRTGGNSRAARGDQRSVPGRTREDCLSDI